MEKIAVVGISCLFPGAKNPQEFFDNLSASKDSTSLASKAQMGVDPDLFFSPQKGVADKYYSKKGGYIREFDFDSSGYLIEAKKLELLDDLYQWSLYTAKEALTDGGYLKREKILKKTGVVLGNLSFPTKSSNKHFLPLYQQAITSTLKQITPNNLLQSDQLQPTNQPYTNSRISGYPATVIAQALGLGGGHFALDAACASSLYSVKLACDYLLTGKADLMLAGAVSAADPLFVNLGFSTFQAYPENGISCPLDAGSGGLIAGEGAGMFVLKRYQEALDDGDKIYAVIGGIGLSNDGRGKFALSPNPRGQKLAYERAYQNKKIDPKDIAYIECHATGTPLGDLTEVNSLEQFFADRNSRLKVGSVKTNFGHLLTAAGMASMLKIIGSLSSSVIPPSIKIKNALCSSDGFINEDKIVTEKLPWPREEGNRYAAVNAFGFGGTNAHLIFMSPQTAAGEVAQNPPTNSFKKPQPIAIIGMDAHFGSAKNLAQFNHYIYTGKQDRVDLPEDRWKGMEKNRELLERYNLHKNTPPQGAFITSLEIDYLRYKIPPNPQDPLIVQQLLMLQVADNALLDSGLKEGINVAVLIAMETDTETHQLRGRVDLDWQLEQYLAESGKSIQPQRLEKLKNDLKESVQNPVGLNQFTSFIGNIMASRISSLWDLTGPAFTISSEENSVFKALELAQIMLDQGEVEAVLIGAVDLFCNVENLLIRNKEFGQIRSDLPNLVLESTSQGWVPGEGAGAIVLRKSSAETKGYAEIKGISLSSCQGVDDFVENVSTALKRSRVTAEQIDYLELYGGATKTEQEVEIKGINRSFKNSSTALGSVKNSFGNLGVASGIAAVIKTALLLNRRYLPGTPNWKAPLLPEEWTNRQFYLPEKSKTWYLDNRKNSRYAAINSLGEDGDVAHCILAESASQKVVQAPLFKEENTQLFTINGNNQKELITGLTGLATKLNQTTSLYQLASELNRIKTGGKLTVSILGDSREQLQKEIRAAQEGIPASLKNGKSWTTPHGSYFTPQPLGKKGKLSFVYPGGFVSYQGMNRDLFQIFPQLHEVASKISSYPERMFRDTQLFPRSLNRLSKTELEKLQTELVDDAIGMFETGITASIIYTHIARKILKINPQTVFGYSMGEVSMMYALGCWGVTDQMSDILHNKPVFKTRLAGRMETLREAWGLPTTSSKNSENIWECHTVSASIKQVEQALQKIDKVYAIIINTPQEVVIAGHPEACKKILGKLKTRSVQIPMTDVIHCELVKADYDKIVELHTAPVTGQPKVDFYTAMNYQKTAVESKQIAENIAQLYCQMVDFPRLVDQVYADGTRIFLELGPQGSCCKSIKEILKDKNYLAIGINRKGVDDYTALLMAMAQLKSHQVELDLTELYPAEKTQPATEKSFIHSVILGGHNIDKIIKENVDRELLKELSKTEPLPKMTGEETAQFLTKDQTKLDFSSFHQLLDQSYHHRQLVGKTQEAFLRSRRESLQLFSEIISLKLSLKSLDQNSGSPAAVSNESPPSAPPWQPRIQDITTKAATNCEAPIQSDGSVQFNEQQIYEFAVGSIAKCFGSDFEIYQGRKSQRNPNGDLQLLSRVLTATGKRKDFQQVASMEGEYDVREDAWFFQQNSYPLIPYSVMMEIALQPCGFLGAYMGSPLIYPQADLYFRNLDATAELISSPDLRNRVITCKSQLHDTFSFSATVIQQYSFQLLVDGELFYQGKTTFGYFTADSLAKQLGIDNGKYIKPWIEESSVARSQQIEYDLTSTAGIEKFYTARPEQPFFYLKRGHLNFLDRAVIVAEGGDYQQGYIYAEKTVNPSDWFFPCHFYQDPVMPGSLGVEAIFQSMKIFALQMELGRGFRSPSFGHCLGEMSWKYRGQIIPKNKKMSLEVHIKSIEQKDGQITISGDASLWKDGLRIYTVTKAAITINENKGEI